MLCLLVTAALAAVVLARPARPPFRGVDDVWLRWTGGPHDGPYAAVAAVLNWFGGPLGVVVPLGLLVVLAVRRRWPSLLCLLTTVIVGNIAVVQSLKFWVDRPRPDNPLVSRLRCVDDGLRLSGVVLAAGRSVRMGRDKALLPASDGSGRAMWERQREVLRTAGCADVYLSARPEQDWARQVRGEGGFAGVLFDALPGCGPLVGITAALERAVDATHVAVVAIDLPRMPAEWFAARWSECEAGVGAVGWRAGAGTDGFFEPLAGIYPREAMWLAWEALARGEYALQPFVRRAAEGGLLRVRPIGEAEGRWFENWNEPRPAGA
jgi:molybdopterin-guanine dinucleotide biosynthesis protein A